jgi:uncharacterized protein YdgA (DUF945 family)
LFIGCDTNNSSFSTSNINIMGKVVDGYIKDATICLDTNLNNICDTDELTTKSDENGSFVFNNIVKSSSIFNIIASGGTDTAINKPYVGTLKKIINLKDTNNSLDTIISPVSNIVATTFLQNKNNLTIEELEITNKKVANNLDLNETTFLNDPMENQDIFLKVQIIEQTKKLLQEVYDDDDEKINLAIVNDILDDTSSDINISKIIVDINDSNITSAQINYMQNQVTALEVELDKIPDDTNLTLKTIQEKVESSSQSVIQNIKDNDLTSVEVIVVSVNSTPVLENIADVQIDEDTNTTITLNASDIDNNTLIYSASSDDENITTSINNNILTLKPSNNYFGNGIISVTVSDGDKNATTTFNIKINSLNDKPTIQNIADVQIDEDTNTTITLNASDIDNNTLIYSASSDDENITTSINNNILTLKPSNNYFGNGIISVTVSDGDKNATTTFNIKINSLNDKPTIQNIADVQIDEDTNTTITLNASDIDNNTLIYSASSDDENITTSINNNILTLKPSNNYFGNGIISVTVSDGDKNATTTFNIKINSLNDKPTIQNIADVQIDEDTNTTITLNASDIDNNTLIYSASSDDENITTSINNNILTLKPSNNYFGNGIISVTVSDGDKNATTTFNIKINSLNDKPTIQNIADVQIDEDTNTTITLNASDIDNNTLIYSQS